MSNLDLDLAERIAVPLSLEALGDLIEWWQGGGDPRMSPPLCLGWDIHRHWPSAGFTIWRDLMHEYEPPLLAAELLDGDQRVAVTLEQYEAALVEQWTWFEREKRWTDDLVVDVMQRARQTGWEVCGSASEATEAILDDLAARSGAKRAAVEADWSAACLRSDAAEDAQWEQENEVRTKKARARVAALDLARERGWQPAAGKKWPDPEVVGWCSLVGSWMDPIEQIEAAIEYFEKKHARYEDMNSGKIPMPSNVHSLHPAAPPADTTPPPPPVLEVFCAASLEGHAVPPRRWHARDLIPAQTVTLMYGDGGTGKSLLALQLLVSTAIGRFWIGRMVEKGACLFVTAEDPRDEVHRRLSDIARENSVPLSAMADLHIVSLAGEDAILAAPEGRSNVIAITPLFTAIEKQIKALRPKLVVLDTLADLFGRRRDSSLACCGVLPFDTTAPSSF